MAKELATKKCSKCDEVKLLCKYYADNSLGDGRASACKACKDEYQKRYHKLHAERRRETHRAYAERNSDQIKEKGRAYYQANREKKLAYLAEWRKKNKTHNSEYNRKRSLTNSARILAGKALHTAIKSGELVLEKSCCVCGSDQHLDYHHHDYSEKNWLKVIPLCRSHHQRLHADDPATIEAVRPRIEALGFGLAMKGEQRILF